MKRDEVLQLVASLAKRNQAVIFIGNAYNARALCALDDQIDFFYMVGSMGLCPTLAAGFSHCMQIPVIAIEGDGNALMGLSGFPVASRSAGGSFVHLVLDNGLYESTGGQQALSSQVDFVQVALGLGYDLAHHPEDLQSLESVLDAALQGTHRTFICVSTEVSTGIIHPRVPYHPRLIAQRFRDAVLSRHTTQERGLK